MPSYIASIDGKINRVSENVLSGLEGRMVIESSHGFILSKDTEDNITVTVDETNLTAEIVNLNYLMKSVRAQDNLVMLSSGYERFIYYNKNIYRYKGSVSTYEGFFIDSSITEEKAKEARSYYNKELTKTLSFCQKMVSGMVNRLTIPMDVLTCIDYITALSKIPI